MHGSRCTNTHTLTHTHTHTEIKINPGDMATDTNKACYIAQGLAAISSRGLEKWRYESCRALNNKHELRWCDYRDMHNNILSVCNTQRPPHASWCCIVCLLYLNSRVVVCMIKHPMEIGGKMEHEPRKKILNISMDLLQDFLNYFL